MNVTTDLLTGIGRQLLEENREDRERKLELRRVRDQASAREEQERREREQAAEEAVRVYLHDRSSENQQAALDAMAKVGQSETDLRRFAAIFDEVKVAERTYTSKSIAKLTQEAEKAQKAFEEEEERYMRPERRLQAARQAAFAASQAASEAERARRQAQARKAKFPALFSDDEADSDE